MKKRPKKTRYRKYSNICDKDIDCFNGEDCLAFKHTSAFSSLRFEKDTEPEYPEDDWRENR